MDENQLDQLYNFTQEEETALDELLKINYPQNLELEKRRVAKKFKLKRFLSNSQIIKRARDTGIFNSHLWVKRLHRKPTRSISGVSIIAVMIPPNLGGLQNSCPFNCSYCPTADNAPKSYLGHEPSTLRAIGHNYDTYKIVKGRIEQLRAIGHPANKLHLVIQGGTFNACHIEEQDKIMKKCFDAITGKASKNIVQAMKFLESSQTRNVGITYETRPDYCRSEHVDRMLERGGTWVEIGTQTLSNSVLKKVKRGHNVLDIYNSVKTAKDAGFKVSLHMIPNMYASPKEDYNTFKELYSNPRLRPDGLKIYPLLIIPGTEIYEEWKNGNFIPYSDEELIDTLAHIKRELPEYTRIHRIQRDIPTKYVEGGLQLGNLRNIIKKKMEQRGWKCLCIRCREVGHVRNLTEYSLPDQNLLKMSTNIYQASGGKEFFFSIIDDETQVLFGFLRMRFPSKEAHRSEITSSTAIVRELHVYGSELGVGLDPKNQHTQHRGLGKKLMNNAEEIALSEGFNEIIVISGIGVREYYKKLGYFQKGPYVAKKLR